VREPDESSGCSRNRRVEMLKKIRTQIDWKRRGRSCGVKGLLAYVSSQSRMSRVKGGRCNVSRDEG